VVKDSPDQCGDREAAAAANPACESCGHPSAREMAGQWLCDDCISVAGSGCAGPVDDGA